MSATPHELSEIEPEPEASRGIHDLAGRLAQLAVEVDRVALEVSALELSAADVLLLATSSVHLESASSGLAEALFRAEKLDQRPVPALPGSVAA